MKTEKVGGTPIIPMKNQEYWEGEAIFRKILDGINPEWTEKQKAKYHKKRYKEYKRIFDTHTPISQKLKKGLEKENAAANVLKIDNHYIYNIEYKKIIIKFLSYSFRHGNDGQTDGKKQKDKTNKRIKELFNDIEMNLKRLENQKEINDDINLYVQTQYEWVNYWKDYNN